MAAAKKRKPTSKAGIKGDAKDEGKTVKASAAKKADSTPAKMAKPPAEKKDLKREAKVKADSPKAAKPKRAPTATVEKKGAGNNREGNKSGITKVYPEKKDICSVTFRLPKAAVSRAKTVCIVGDFNDWNIYADPMTRLKDGTYSIELQLSKGKEYQFRYLIDDRRWENDWNADKYVKNPFGDSDNSVVVV